MEDLSGAGLVRVSDDRGRGTLAAAVRDRLESTAAGVTV
jgi:hypothetical protein